MLMLWPTVRETPQARNIVLLRDGRIIQRGSYRELVSDPAEAFVVEFVKTQRSLHVETLNA